MERFSNTLAEINDILWHDNWLFLVVATGLVFTIWSGLSQYRVLTLGPKIIRGDYDDPSEPGAISHYQALSAALSGTIGLGNIGGVALAISLGGPGAVLWMWVIGFLGMATKLTEVTLSMLYRNTDNPEDPHGGPMWVVSKALSEIDPAFAGLGKLVGALFCMCLLTATITGGNMFQAWNVGGLTNEYFGIPTWMCGVVLAVLVSAVMIGGVKRIGNVASTLVPLMCILYLIAGVYVLAANFEHIPSMFALIVASAFSQADATGAFVGGTAASAFIFGMKRAIFSNEAGIGTSPIAHCAAKTGEPVREGIVGGLEPFIDTIVVCTITALIILSTGVWNRSPDVLLDRIPGVLATDKGWQYADSPIQTLDLKAGERVYLVVEAGHNPTTGFSRHTVSGVATSQPTGVVVAWHPFVSQVKPQIVGHGFYKSFVGATLTAKAFDSVMPGLGKWLITLSAWMFALSTTIAWGYYGEQGIVFLTSKKTVGLYRFVYCMLPMFATIGWIESDKDLDNLTGLGTGLMLLANLPILWVLGYKAMRAYRVYIEKMH